MKPAVIPLTVRKQYGFCLEKNNNNVLQCKISHVMDKKNFLLMRKKIIFEIMKRVTTNDDDDNDGDKIQIF